MHDDVLEVLLSEKEIIQICKKMGEKITNDYRDKTPILVGLLKGCIPFMAELSKNIDTHVEMEYMAVSSYHGKAYSSGDVKISYDLSVSVKDRDIILVEDIVDSGATIKTIIDLLNDRGAASVVVATLLDKPEGRKVDVVPKYIGKVIPKKFVIGFGLDYNELYRNLRYVGVLKPSVYEK